MDKIAEARPEHHMETNKMNDNTFDRGNNLPNNLAMNALAGENITANTLQAALTASFKNMETSVAKIQTSELELSILVAALVRRARNDRESVIQAIGGDHARWKALKKSNAMEVEVSDVLYGIEFPKIDDKSVSSRARIKVHAEFLAKIFRNDEASYFDKLATLHTMQDLRRLRKEMDVVQARRQPARNARIKHMTKLLVAKGTVANDDGTAPSEGGVGIAIVVAGKNGAINTYGFLHTSCYGNDNDAEKRYLSTVSATLKAMLVGRGFDEKEISKQLSQIEGEAA
jgi:hypothetical protein